mgnify:CR=1 FL=1
MIEYINGDFMEVFEDKNICSKCKGKCCKKCGCDYAPNDFESLSIDYLQNKLESGNISIVATLVFERLNNGKLTCTPILYLRARNKNRPIVDLISIKTTCSLLTENGCPYEYKDRPSGAKNVIPMPDFNCKKNISQEDLIIIPWLSYQKTLSRLVKRLTGNSVDKQILIDVLNLYKELYKQDFNDVSKIELLEVLELLPYISEVYKEEFNEVFKDDIYKMKVLSKYKKKSNLI